MMLLGLQVRRIRLSQLASEESYLSSFNIIVIHTRLKGTLPADCYPCVVHLRADQAYVTLAETIEQYSFDSEFHFYPNPGNWGDSLINAGTEEFFTDYSFNYVTLERQQLINLSKSELPRLAVVGGGGGWCRNWASTPKFLQAVSEKYQHVILLPTSFDPQLPAPPTTNISPFSRDKLVTSDAVFYCPDMAFYFNFEGGVPTLSYPLLAFRRDKERNIESISPYRNFDLSLLGNASNSPKAFVEVVSHFEEIYTDRLHIAITATMLGRKVRILEGNYQKNRGVYEASMRGRFANVELISWKDFRTRDVRGTWSNS